MLVILLILLQTRTNKLISYILFPYISVISLFYKHYLIAKYDKSGPNRVYFSVFIFYSTWILSQDLEVNRSESCPDIMGLNSGWVEFLLENQ